MIYSPSQQGADEMVDRYFTKKTFYFLSALAANNKRKWFDAHRQDYEAIKRRRTTASDRQPDELSLRLCVV